MRDWVILSAVWAITYGILCVYSQSIQTVGMEERIQRERYASYDATCCHICICHMMCPVISFRSVTLAL